MGRDRHRTAEHAELLELMTVHVVIMNFMKDSAMEDILFQAPRTHQMCKNPCFQVHVVSFNARYVASINLESSPNRLPHHYHAFLSQFGSNPSHQPPSLSCMDNQTTHPAQSCRAPCSLSAAGDAPLQSARIAAILLSGVQLHHPRNDL